LGHGRKSATDHLYGSDGASAIIGGEKKTQQSVGEKLFNLGNVEKQILQEWKEEDPSSLEKKTGVKCKEEAGADGGNSDLFVGSKCLTPGERRTWALTKERRFLEIRREFSNHDSHGKRDKKINRTKK